MNYFADISEDIDLSRYLDDDDCMEIKLNS